jgi:hypothetical protein
MNITLPDEMREELELKAKIAGFSSVEKYVAELVHTDEGPIAVSNPPTGACYAVSTREELVAKLLEGQNTAGDVVAAPDFWEGRLKAAQERANKGELQ